MNDVTATFLGATTLLISDGQTNLLTDGFFSRPSMLRVALGRVRPNPAAIERGLARAGITRLEAVLVGHSHYDHALDAPEVVRRCGACLVGSPSTANIGRGWGLPDGQIRIIEPGQALAFGAFRVTFLASEHSNPNAAAGQVRLPLGSPAHARAYKDGGVYTMLIEHPGGALLVQESAGFIPGALNGRYADAVFLSVAMLARQKHAYRTAYFNEVVGVVGARVVYPIHHDNFTCPLGGAIEYFPRWIDDTPAALRALREWAESHAVTVDALPPWQAVRIF
jgi:L-ascorbate metabolism protein UlaG (beta-lactamase superfamily)